MNTFGIPEVTLSELGDSTHIVNKIGAIRHYPLQVAVVRVTDHIADAGVDVDTQPTLDHAALFYSKSLTAPWILGGSKDAATHHTIHHAVKGTAPSNVTILFPDFIYTVEETFEVGNVTYDTQAVLYDGQPVIYGEEDVN